MQDLWFKGPVWFKGKVIKSPVKVPTPFRKTTPERIPHKIAGNIISTRTFLKFKTRY